MTKDERLSYVALLAAGVLFFVWIGPSEIDSGENASISPRLLPYTYAGLIMVLALFQLVSSFRHPVEGWAITREHAGRLGVVLVALSLSAWLAGVSWLDRDVRFWVAAVPATLTGLWLTEVKSPRFIVLYTAGIIAATWVLVEVTGIQLR